MSKTGLQAEVIDYLLKHPELLKKTENSFLYEKFKTVSKSHKSMLRKAKTRALEQYKKNLNIDLIKPTEQAEVKKTIQTKETNPPTEKTIPALDILKTKIESYQQIAIKKNNMSLQSEVTSYLLKNPKFFSSPITDLYKKFQAKTLLQRSTVRTYKCRAEIQHKKNMTDFIERLEADKDILQAMIADYKQATSIDFILSEQDFEPERPFKTFSYSLSEKLHQSFDQICKELKVSKRKGIHLALKGFINFYGKKEVTGDN